VDGASETEKARMTVSVAKQDVENFVFHASSSDFAVFPGSPIAYWASRDFLNAYQNGTQLGDICEIAVGLFTCDNERFLRNWYEVSHYDISFYTEDMEDTSIAKYYPYNKGGGFRKWYGLNELIVYFKDKGISIRDHRQASGQSWSLPGEKFYFRSGVTWSGLTSNANSFRWSDKGFIFESNKGQMLFSDISQELLLFLNSVVCKEIVSLINPTLSLQSNEVKKIVYQAPAPSGQMRRYEHAVSVAKFDWDAYEISWDFTIQPLLLSEYSQPTFKATYHKLRAHWREMTLEMQRLEEENNSIFIEAYGLQDELKPEVPLSEITLTCNPHYRYGNDKSEEELEALLLADTMRELVSYVVGCMFGRYALDKPGLILASQGETIEDYLKRVPEPSFPADDDNVIPMLDGDWFTDDIAERFRKFLRVAFGDEHYEANLKFVEKALGKNGKARDIRDYFLKDFYNDHVKRYKKRPIYWLFSSPKGSFNALIYMHRYRPDTVSVVLNDYLREFRTKLTSHKNHLEAVSISGSASQSEKTKALKEIEKITRMIAEMEEYEREVLYPLAIKQVEINLDDGVKVNYPKLGAALKKIPGLDASNE
jgi:hypothetical protein